MKHRRVDRAHLAFLDEGLCVVVWQETQKLPRENQRGNRLLVVARGLALQAHLLAQLHIGRVITQTGKGLLAQAVPVGGLVGGLIYLVWPEPKPDPRDRATVDPVRVDESRGRDSGG